MRLVTLFLVLPALLAVACVGPAARQDAAVNPEEVKSAGKAAGAQCDDGKEPWRAQTPPKRGGTFVLAANDIPDLDATGSQQQTRNGLLVGRGCYPSDGAVVPALAKSWQVSTDGLVWTLKLRDDVKWHNKPPVNGRRFTSADVAWNIEYHKKGGIAAAQNLRSYWEPVTHEEPDPYTVVLRLKDADADFGGKLGSGVNIMVPREILEQPGGDLKTTNIGTGAYMVKSFQPQNVLVLEANPDYYEKGIDGKPLPYVDEVRVTRFGDYAAELAALRAGQIDSTSTFGLTKLDSDALLKANLKFQQWLILQPTYGALWFDPKKKPWDDARVRRATSLAIDRDALIVANQGGVALSGFVPAYFSDYGWPEAKLKEKFKYDPEEAKKLLAEAGYSNPPGLELLTSGQYQQDAEVVQHALENVGIRTTVKISPSRSWTAVLQEAKFELGWGIVGGSIVDFPGYWAGDLVRTGSSLNVARFSDPAVDALAVTQSREIDPAKRKEIVDRMQDKLLETMPLVPTVSKVYYNFLNCRVKNFKLVHLGRNPSGPMHAWLDQAGC